MAAYDSCMRRIDAFWHGDPIPGPPLMKVIIIKEGVSRKGKEPKYTALIVEDDGSLDGGRIIGRVNYHDEALAICKAMEWEISDDEFRA